MNFEAVRHAYARVLEWVVIVLMTVLFIEVMLGVIYRTIGVSLVWYDEVASILLAWLTFYGSALASVKRAHIGCPELVAIMPPGMKVAARVVSQALVIAFFLLMGWMGYSILGPLDTDRLVSLPDVPVSWPQSVIPISSVLIVLAEIVTFPSLIAEAKRRHKATPGGIPPAQPAVSGGASQ